MNNLNGNYLDPSVRWTDKLTLCPNGDIIEDFSGKIVGHITADVKEADKEVKTDLCKTCKHGDVCELSTKMFSDCRTTNCYKYEEADNDKYE